MTAAYLRRCLFLIDHVGAILSRECFLKLSAQFSLTGRSLIADPFVDKGVEAVAKFDSVPACSIDRGICLLIIVSI